MTNNVSRYYDSNTKRFIRFGHGRSGGAIHRAVWGEGVSSRPEAVDYVNTLIAGFISEYGAVNLLDIGCGIGGSMASLFKKSGVSVTGVTISPVQAKTGRDYLESMECSGKCRIYEGDFFDPEITATLIKDGNFFEMLFAVESFLHMEDSDRFFSISSELLSEGGKLIICDDFLSSDCTDEKHKKSYYSDIKKEGSLIGQFKSGWHVKTLLTPEEAEASAEKYGFRCISRTDLTPNLELNRPRDLFIRAIVPAVKFLGFSGPFWNNLTGGDALQQLLNRRKLQYIMLVFKKNEKLN